MNADLIRFIVKDLPDDEPIVTFWYDKQQANDYASDNDEEPVTDAEWRVIWENMAKDKNLNQMADDLFAEVFWKVINKRKGSK